MVQTGDIALLYSSNAALDMKLLFIILIMLLLNMCMCSRIRLLYIKLLMIVKIPGVYMEP